MSAIISTVCSGPCSSGAQHCSSLPCYSVRWPTSSLWCLLLLEFSVYTSASVCKAFVGLATMHMLQPPGGVWERHAATKGACCRHWRELAVKLQPALQKEAEGPFLNSRGDSQLQWQLQQ